MCPKVCENRLTFYGTCSSLKSFWTTNVPVWVHAQWLYICLAVQRYCPAFLTLHTRFLITTSEEHHFGACNASWGNSSSSDTQSPNSYSGFRTHGSIASSWYSPTQHSLYDFSHLFIISAFFFLVTGSLKVCN